ncbi:putative capsid protein [Rhodococcus phage REQ1]|uniref:head maturation protease n=1 Tax=Rhodococcus phage REQ1 TaxID=1109712 RepID=UPI00023EEC67|nr:head maturation protease [Rhodococcus phage REQ1]AEV52065.1 putative capsid protein [Rhodococcus phage REQ1]
MDLCSRSVEFRANTAAGDGDGRTLEGYAAVFDQDTEINSWEGRFTERIAKGAFKKTLRERKPIMQYDHGRDSRVGSVPIGVYEDIREDEHGLFVSGRVFDNPVVEPIRQAIEGGAVTGMSFKFRVTRDEWTDKNGKRVRGDEISKLLWEPGDRGPLARTIREVSLFEAGPVSTPAYAGTSVGVRMTEQDREALAAEYRRTMAETEAEQDVVRWLEAEAHHENDVRTWLDAETEYRKAVSLWLAAESEYKTSIETDAARTGTSAPIETPEADAARSRGTSNREDTNTPILKRSIPMTLEELRARLAEIDVRLSDIGAEYRDAELPEAEQAEWDGLDAERAKVASSIERIEARIKRMGELADTGSTERGTDTGTPAFHARRDIHDIDAIRREARSEEDFVERLQDNARRATEKMHFSPQVSRDAAQERIERLLVNVDSKGDLAKRILVTGTATYERAFGKAALSQSLQGLTAEEARALALGADVASGSNGGFAVPVQLDPTVIHTSAIDINPLRGLARVVQITGKEWQGVTSANGIVVSRGTEASATDGSSPTLAQPKVRAERVSAFVPFSFEIEQDWSAMRQEITLMLGEAKDAEEAGSFLTGDGLGVNPQGLLTGVGAGQDVAGSISPALTSGDIYALEEALPNRYRANARFLGAKATYNRIRQIDTAGGADLWERLGAGLPSQLIGYPLHEASKMDGYPKTAAAKRVLVLGDFRNFLIVDRIGMSIELVPHVFATSGGAIVPTGQRGLFAVWRNNSKVLVPDAFRVLKTKAS